MISDAAGLALAKHVRDPAEHGELEMRRRRRRLMLPNPAMLVCQDDIGKSTADICSHTKLGDFFHFSKLTGWFHHRTILFIIVQAVGREHDGLLSDAKAWWLVGFLWVAYFLNYCDRQVVYAIFPVLKTELGFTNTQLGLTGAIFIWTTGLASPLAGLCAAYSRQRLLVTNLLLWSATTFLTGFSSSPTILLFGRAMLGITEALFIPLAVSLIGSSLRASFRARAMGLFFTAQLCGVVVGGSLGG